IALVLGGPLLFPTTQLVLRLMGRRASLGAGNPFGQLATQVAFTIPVMFPVAVAAALHRHDWFYPACMVVVGAHYLPFIFLYGMWEFGALAGALVAGGLLLGLYGPASFTLGGWLTAACLVVFGVAQIIPASRREPQRA